MDESHPESIYDRYSAIMYGTILNIVKDKTLAEIIFIDAFLSLLIDKHFIEKPKLNMSLFVVMYSKVFTKKYLDGKRG